MLGIIAIDWQEYLRKIIEWSMSNGLHILAILIVMFIAIKLVKKFTFHSFVKRKGVHDEEYLKRTETLSKVITSASIITILIVGLLMILAEFEVEIAPIIAAAGIGGIALGFGAQHLVKDVISGFFILLEDQIRVNDVVLIGGKGGLVEKVGLRITILRDLAGNVHYVPNGEINVVTNMTKDYSRYVFEIGVAYREDVDEVIEIIKEVDEDLRNDPEFADSILEPIEVLGLDEFADSAIIIKARTKTKPIKQWSVGREFNRRLKKAFDERDIEIPFPHTTLYLGQDKAGQAPPLNVELIKENNNTNQQQ